MGAACETEYGPVFAKVRERLAISKQAARKFNGERVNHRNPNEVEVRKEYQIDF
jgi:hypothetical protein